MYTLILQTAPIAKGRPRFTRQGRVFTPAKTRNAEAEMRWLLAQWWLPKTPLLGPLEIEVKFYFLRPRSVSKQKRAHHVVKPDLSNTLKTLEDAGNGLVWHDDSQIIAATISKSYDTTQRIELRIKEI